MYEIILNLGQQLRRRCHLKIILFATPVGHFARWRGTVCAILVKRFVIDNFVKGRNEEPLHESNLNLGNIFRRR